jgi:hypothetical protein
MCRCSNIKTHEQKVKSWRPDYVAGYYTTSTKTDVPLLYAEIKPDAASQDFINKDIYRIAVLSKLALLDYELWP